MTGAGEAEPAQGVSVGIDDSAAVFGMPTAPPTPPRPLRAARDAGWRLKERRSSRPARQPRQHATAPRTADAVSEMLWALLRQLHSAHAAAASHAVTLRLPYDAS